MNIVLLIGRNYDPHICGIIDELKKNNQEYLLLDSFTSSDFFTVKHVKEKIDNFLNYKDQKINLNNVISVWNTSSLQILVDQNTASETRKFMEAEWTEGINTLWNSIDARWVNSPKSIISSVNRLDQLRYANEIGLETPNSLVTNNSDSLLEFFEENDGQIIAKTLNSSKGLPKDFMIYTTKIEKRDLEKINDIRYAPCMFQEYIPKKTEFRVTIIGDTINSAEIFSQKSTKTMHDWRKYDDFEKTPYHIAKLPDSIEEQLLKLMKKMGLKFGGVDLIRTPSDDFIFLEVNPNGRWWWIQELTGMNIAKDIADYLSLQNC